MKLHHIIIALIVASVTGIVTVVSGDSVSFFEFITLGIVIVNSVMMEEVKRRL